MSTPERIELAMKNTPEKQILELTEWAKLSLYDPVSGWQAKTVQAMIAPGLCSPIILGLPFLSHNELVTNHAAWTIIHRPSGIDLMNPKRPEKPAQRPRLRERLQTVRTAREGVIKELKARFKDDGDARESRNEKVKTVDVIGAIRERIEVLAAQEKLLKLGAEMKREFSDMFEPIPHADTLPCNVFCRIKLKDASQTIKTRSYSTPRKYRSAWETLIQQHLDAGRIQPSSSSHASPAFLIPKADLSALPRWVNNYRALNANTVMDAHPLPQIDDILADCAKGKIWSKIDMTNSFFQT
jgi:hypothetical protein